MTKLLRNELDSIISEEVPDVETLVMLLELSMEDILDRFHDKVIEHKDKFGLPDTVDGILEEEVYEEDEE